MRGWSAARSLAEQTRPERNRYIDFVRAVSISVVVTGHWLMSSFYYENGRLAAGDILELQPNIRNNFV